MTQHMIVWPGPNGYTTGTTKIVCATGKIEKVGQVKVYALILLVNPISLERVWAIKAC